MRSARTGWTLAAVSATVLGCWLVVGRLGDVGPHGLDAVTNVYPSVVFGLAFPVVGALILSRLPGHRLGWLYSLCGLDGSVSLAAHAYAQRGLVDQPGSLPGALLAGWLSSWIWVFGFSPLLTLGVLWFPDGRLPSRRWWPVPALVALVLGVGAVSLAVRPGPLEDQPVRDNPLGLALPPTWFEAVRWDHLWLLLLPAILGSLAGLGMRYRCGSAGEREHLRWFLSAAALFALCMLAPVAFPAGSAAGVASGLLALVALPLLPLSVGVAVLRHRLYGVDVALRRSLVYGWLLAAGLGLYAAVVLVLDAVLRGHGQPAVALLGAGLVAVLYQPLRLRLQRATERMFYGDRGDPYAVLAAMGRRLELSGSVEGALPQTVAVIAGALRLPYAAIHLPDDPIGQPTAEYGTRPVTPPLSIPLMHGGVDVGRLVVGRRDPRGDLRPLEVRLLADVGRQVAVAAHAAQLDRALRRSRERLVLAREEERRRLRRDLHDGLGPTLAGVALGVDAARNLLLSDPQLADELLRDLKGETLNGVREVRRIVEDLRPPALDEIGLLSALSVFADRLSSRERALRLAVESPDPLPPLPAAVEVAAYRIATEAMTNVARHARASCCVLRLDVAADLTIEVCDDGVGVSGNHRFGVGLPSMAERAAELGGSCVLTPVAGGGTRVLAHLPLSDP